jgi:hypothetical protein
MKLSDQKPGSWKLVQQGAEADSDDAKPLKLSELKAGSWDLVQQGENPKTDVADSAQAGLEHFGNAASMGYMPQIQGFVSQLMPDPSAEVDAKLREQGFKIDQKSPTYISERDAYIKHLEQQEKDHPIASTVGTVGGALASGVATSGLTPINAASRLGRVAQAAKGGAAIGAVANPGDKEGQLTGFQVSDRIGNAVTGAALGAAGQGAVEGVSATAKGVMNLPKALQAKAEERAFKSSGAMLKDYRNADRKGRINVIGRYMLDNGLVKPGMTVDDVAEAAAALEAKHGKDIGSILGGLDQSGIAAPSHSAMASEIDAIAEPMKGLNTARPTFNALDDAAADLRTMGRGGEVGVEGKGTFKTAQEAKVFISDQIEKAGGWNSPNPSEKNLALREAYHKANSMIENAAEVGAASIGDDALAGGYRTAKEGYRNAKDVQGIAKDQANRQKANHFNSITDYMAGSGGAIVGAMTGDDMESKIKNAAVGASLGGANRLMRRYGTPLVSQGLDRAGKALGRTYLGEMGEAAAPALKAIEKSPASAANTVGVMSRPKLERAPQLKVAEDEPKQNRAPSEALKGEAKWAQSGAQKLGVDPSLANDPKARKLLIEASDLPAGSKRLQSIKNQLQGRGN